MTKEEIISYTELSMRSIELDNDKDTVAYDFYKSVLKILQIDPCKTCQKVKTTFKQTANEYEVTCEPITEPCEDIWKFALHCMELGYGVDILKQYTASEAMAKLEKFKKLESIAPCGDAISRKHLLLEIDDLMKSPWFNRYKDDCGALHFGYIERKEAVEIVRDLCVKTEPLVQPKASCSEKPNDCEGCISRQAAIKETLKYTMTSEIGRAHV